MTDILSEIVQRKKHDVHNLKKAHPAEQFQNRLQPSDRDFKKALKKDGPAYIMEIKKASPSRGVLRADFDLDAICDVYGRYADAVSVLTDGPYFQGSFEYLRAARSKLTRPLLCKDFIIDPWQVLWARWHGADAILLMLSVLDDATWHTLATVARQWGMDVLTETHDSVEMERALRLNADIIGINNRNLKDLSIDTDTTLKLAPRAGGHAVLVAESGLFTRSDVARLQNAASAFLVGSALMADPQLERAVRRLIFGAVKVCGLTRSEDAQTAWRAGALYGGMIFAEQSPRCIDEKNAERLMQSSPLDWVGVFVDAPPETVARKAGRLGLHAVQLHGSESGSYLRDLRERLPEKCAIWKALPVDDRLPPEPEGPIDRLVLDTRTADAFGGSGVAFDWNDLQNTFYKRPVMLAGGLNPDNITRALTLPVAGFDVNSGVESRPGIKDARKINELFDVLRKGRS